MNDKLSTSENGKETDVRLKNLIPGGPGRPKGQKNYSTIYRQALRRIGEAKQMTPWEVEVELEKVGLEKAFKGDFKFWQDIRDRVHGKAVVRTENKNLNASVTLQDEEKERLDDLIK